MPGIGCEAAIQLIQQNEATKHIPVVLFSAASDLPAIAIKLNADGYLEKPFNIFELSATILKYLIKTKQPLL